VNETALRAPALPGRGVVLWLGALVAAVAGFLVFQIWVPAEGREASICVLRRCFDLPCPTCGMTRGLAHLAKGEWGAAWSAHPLAAPFALEMFVLWVVWGLRLGAPAAPRWAARLRSHDWELQLLFANLAIFGAVWLGRLATGTLPR
jgi:hypothetical protein